MMTGGGASRLATTMAAVGVPSMSKQTFTTTERAWSAEMEKQLIISMKEAGAEEKRIAIEKGRRHHGVPAITVIVGLVKEEPQTQLQCKIWCGNYHRKGNQEVAFPRHSK